MAVAIVESPVEESDGGNMVAVISTENKVGDKIFNDGIVVSAEGGSTGGAVAVAVMNGVRDGARDGVRDGGTGRGLHLHIVTFSSLLGGD